MSAPASSPASAFAGKRALVTGGGSGVGAALATALAAAGCEVYLAGRTIARLTTAAERLRAGGASAWPLACDLAEADDIARLAETIRTRTDALDLLLHCAGAIDAARVEEAGVAAFDAQLDANVRGPYLLTQALLPALRAARGQIVFLNSTAGLHGKAGVAAYSASKHALKGFADSLRDEVNADGVRVMSVYLGRTDTPMQQALHRAQGQPYDGRRFLQPEDVATVLLPLLQLPACAEVTDFVLRPLAK